MASTPFKTETGAVANTGTWQEAVDNLVAFLISQRRCFTSGEVTDIIRTHRKDLRFKHSWVGERVQDAFYNGYMPSYDDGAGGEAYPTLMDRHTVGAGRTPAGTMVHVYGPDLASVDTYDFERDIAAPGQTARDSSQPQAGQVSPAAAMLGGGPPAPSAPPVTPNKVAVANGCKVPGDPVAVIHNDGRLCVPRLAFEMLAQESGHPVKGGEPLSMTCGGNEVVISQQSLPGGRLVTPTTDQLRVHITLNNPRQVGQQYVVELVQQGGVPAIRINLD